MKLKVIGFGHRKRSGKDTCGQYMVAKHGFTRVAFADPLKQSARAIFGFTRDQCYGTDEQKEAVDPRWGFSPRYAMQTLGEKMRGIFGDDVWIKSAESVIQRMSQGVNVIHITAGPDGKVWEPTDAEVANLSALFAKTDTDPEGAVVVTRTGIKSQEIKGTVVITDVRYPNEAEMIRRNGGIVIRIDRPSLGPLTDTHASETSMELFEYDDVIVNDGTIEQLYEKIEQVLTRYE